MILHSPFNVCFFNMQYISSNDLIAVPYSNCCSYNPVTARHILLANSIFSSLNLTYNSLLKDKNSVEHMLEFA